jgi:hypothetical protein
MPLRTGCQDVHLGAHASTVSNRRSSRSNISELFQNYSISSRMAWDWCKMVCSSVVKILVKLDLDRLSQPRVIIPGHEALAPLMLVAKPLVSFKVRLPYHLPRISLLINLWIFIVSYSKLKCIDICWPVLPLLWNWIQQTSSNSFKLFIYVLDYSADLADPTLMQAARKTWLADLGVLLPFTPLFLPWISSWPGFFFWPSETASCIGPPVSS